MANRRDLPAGFQWGAATAAYQVEGAVAEDGRGPSIWDVFAARPGAVRDGHTGELACDHYHRYGEDVELMRGLGLDGYRFSIAWPRVRPSGSGAVNKAGLDFYDRLVDELLAAGITPLPTLFHWDLPQALEDGGGWLARDTAYRFAEYARIVVDRLGDRVPAWITLNEPFVHMVYGYALGVHAPGRALMLDALPAAHHQLLGHGLAAAVLRERGHQVLIANNLTPVWSASEAVADVAAAAAYDALHNRLFTDPLLLGRYPDLSAYGVAPDLGGSVRPGDLELIAGAGLDGLGVNYYNPTRIAAPTEPAGLPFAEAEIEGVPRTAFGWPVVPDGLRELLVGLRDRYGTALPPITITENGCSVDDRVAADGTVHDQPRIDYLAGHLDALAAAVAQGVDVRGYYTWSLLDNYEWAEGYHQRFGLVHVDFATQRRTPKASYGWYRDLMTAHRVSHGR
ncbi:GH1 family beta-glucosidase [Kitasatospora sp. NBC_01287]|uniref:GH1 family beta-glucosidase n=1 Tax=Kitasatospora sp. NBC_01287 TaxID=2903573 RepID=UPI00225151A7|nr:GH1 family beta-glucosidase [Kitasatospora sp. NBC_01287]MCX4744608.1 GH1 family beta-glucosidase [Kitasatospora sp. NBC_01287]